MRRVIVVSVCVLLLAAAWLFWPRGGGAPAPVKSPAASAAVVTSVAPAATNAAPAPAAAVVTRSTASTNRVAFRLANTTRTLGELTASPRAILLENALVDTSAKLELNIPKHLRATMAPGAFIVQARGPVTAAFRAVLASAGAQIVSYIPNNAYLVQLSGAGAGGLAGDPLVQAVLPYEPYFKLQSSLLSRAVEQKPLPDGQVLTLGLFANGASATVVQIEKLGGTILATDRSPFGPLVRVQPQPGSDWLALAQLPGVQRVEPATRRQLANDLARVTMALTTDYYATNENWLGLSGSNVVVEVNDTGVDANHPDFSVTGTALAPGTVPPSRVSGWETNSTIDNDGHGTHVGGIIAGNGSMSLTLTNTPSGSVTNADMRGKAPAAKLFAVGFLGANDTNIAYSDRMLQEIPALTNALISNNSWINAGDNEYDLSAAGFDAAVRDALPGTTGPQPVLFVFAAGNDGGGEPSGIGGAADSILSPATAKNVVTVGALEQYRNITNEVVALDGTTNAIWVDGTDSSSQVAAYSARGNVGVQTEGTYGRFKPDVVAPGTFVVSTRSTTWDKAAYYNPTNYHDEYSQGGLIVTSNQLAYGGGSVPINGVGLTIKVEPNRLSPVPFPTNFPIYLALSGLAGPANFDVATSNNVLSVPPGGGTLTTIGPLLNAGFSCAVADPTNIPINFDLFIQITTTNDDGNRLMVLSNLNETIGPWYYYESGTSMAAPAVSGTLALLQDFFVNQRNPAFTTNPSPALLKAMLINGARLTPGYNNFAITNNINYEGWGLVQVPNSVPLGLTNTAAGTNGLPMFVLDQSPTNALATGDSRTFNVTVPSLQARAQDLRFTLAWTDPPGNPAAGIKLVNNLDLIVTNKDDGRVYYGNTFGEGTLSIVVNSNTTPDSINNVENIWIASPTGTNYSVTVLGRNVAVNAVTAEQTNVVQDFALVISSGTSVNTNGITVTPVAPTPTTAIMPQVTYVQSYTNGIYFNQLAGANAPWLSTNDITIGSGFGTNASLFVGQTNQWHFYVVTNTTTFTNAAFIIFLPQTQADPRMGVFTFSAANATRPEADLNLFVSSTPDVNAGLLTNLDLTVISNCVFNVNGDQSSLARGGTKFIVYTNSTLGQVYNIGVQCEDQMGGEYGFLAFFSENPFSQMQNGKQVVNGFPLPQPIPDGTPAHGGVGYVFGLAIYPMDVNSVTVTNTITHQDYGDLIGVLNHNNTSVVLNNHDGGIGNVTNYTTVYNDDGLAGTVHVDGPGTLRSYKGKEAAGPWLMTQVDDALNQTGSITGFSMSIEPHVDLTHGLQTVFVPAGGWWYGYVDVPVGYTNMLVVATNITSPPLGPVQMYLNFDVEPDFTNYLVRADLTNGVPPGNEISYGPPLQPGRYFVGLFNPSAFTQEILIGVTLAFNASAINELNFEPGGPMPLLDDAVTNSYLFVTNTDTIQDISVGLRVDHERISDLVFHLISPDGTRYLLMENRGGQSTNGCGATVITTNIVNVTANGGAQAQTNSINVGMTSGTFPITYNFFNAPDQMTVYYGTNPATFYLGSPYLLVNTGMTNNGPLGGPYTLGTINVTLPPPGVPANSTYLTIVMNQFGNPDTNTLWTYTAGGVLTNTYYLSFTEDTNLTTTPIKYAVPPFVPVITTNIVLTTNTVTIPTNVSVLAGPILNTNNNHSYYLLSSTNWTVSEAWAVALGGHLVTIEDKVEDNWVFNTFKSYGGTNRNLWIGLWDPNNDTTTVAADHATNFVWVSGSTSAYRNWYPGEPNNGGSGGIKEYYGMIDYFYNGQWQDGVDAAQLLGKPEPQNGVVEVVPVTTNILLVAQNLYYQPEDDISGLVGTSAYGEWTLEILDNRAGMTNNAQLVSWQLNFTFANTNFSTSINTNPFTGPVTNFIPGGALQWYLINVPTNADIATNSLLFATLPLQMWWSTNAPPTVTNAADVQLLNNSTAGTAILYTNSSPAFIVPGGSYYLGIQNTNAGGATYAIDVTFHIAFGVPTIITLPASNITSNSATLNALVNPNNFASDVYFEYGATTNYGLFSATNSLTTNLGLQQGVSIDVTNLTPGAVYHFRAVGTNFFGVAYGADLTFTNPYITPAPYATTLPGTMLTGSSAQLNGFATANGEPAIAWFEFGTSTGYGLKTPPVNVGSNYNVVFVTNQLSGLITNQPYHYRLVISNLVGVTYGFDQQFDQANVVAWGADYIGQATVPPGLTNLFVSIGAGYEHSLAVNNDGTVVAWGNDTFGQTNIPAGLNNAVYANGGERDSLALLSDRTVLVWGSNQFRQTNTPPGLVNAVAAASGGYHCIALGDDGKVVCWGFNGSGQTNVPAGLTNVVAVSAGEMHSVALKNDGTVVAWGYNADGETDVPPGLTNVVAISAGGYHTLALKSDGTVVAWGYNASGQTNVPGSLANVVAVAGGGYHSLALRRNGTVVGWGDNSANQLLQPPGMSNVVAIAGGGLHSLALSAQFGLNQTNTPPFWTNGLNGSTVTMNEMTTLLVTNRALDANRPPQTLLYSFISAPPWAAIDSFTGIITLTPAETNGPSTNVIITLVTDNGFPTASATNSFTVIVNEVNRPPVLTLPPNTNIVSLVPFTALAAATDPDVPTNALTFALVSGPAGLTVSTNGIINWTPTIFQAGTNLVFVSVTDTNPWALVNRSLSVTNSFAIVVTNPPGTVTNINIASIVYTNIGGSNGFLLTWFAPSNFLFQVQWTDTLSPMNWQTFTNPSSVTYNTNFPASAASATFTFFDDGSQAPFTGTRFYRLLLLTNAPNVAPVFTLGSPLTRFVSPTTTLTVTNVATDANAGQTLTYALISPSVGVNIDTNTGVITWTNVPLALAGTTNNAITTVVTDNGTPPLSATNIINVAVNPLPLFGATIFGTNGTTLQWTGWTNEQFQVQWTTNLSPAAWTLYPDNLAPLIITSTNGTFTFVDTNSPSLMKFYQLILLP